MRKRNKTAKIDARISDRLRFGVELMARKLGISVSAYASRALEIALISDGIARKVDGEMYSLLDRVWHPNEAFRLIALEHHAPELVTPEEEAKAKFLLLVKNSASLAELTDGLKNTSVGMLFGQGDLDELVDLATEILPTNPTLAASLSPGALAEALKTEFWS